MKSMHFLIFSEEKQSFDYLTTFSRHKERNSKRWFWLSERPTKDGYLSFRKTANVVLSETKSFFFGLHLIIVFFVLPTKGKGKRGDISPLSVTRLTNMRAYKCLEILVFIWAVWKIGIFGKETLGSRTRTSNSLNHIWRVRYTINLLKWCSGSVNVWRRKNSQDFNFSIFYNINLFIDV